MTQSNFFDQTFQILGASFTQVLAKATQMKKKTIIKINKKLYANIKYTFLKFVLPCKLLRLHRLTTSKLNYHSYFFTLPQKYYIRCQKQVLQKIERFEDSYFTKNIKFLSGFSITVKRVLPIF